MGNVNVTIKIRNNFDVESSKRGLIEESEIRQVTVEALVDTGARTLVINRELFNQLGLREAYKQEANFANNSKSACAITDPVEIHWEDRAFSVPAIVLEDIPKILLGVLPLEGMDLIVDTVNEKLIGANGDKPVYFI
jgi:clan AA aspartic protease